MAGNTPACETESVMVLFFTWNLCNVFSVLQAAYVNCQKMLAGDLLNSRAVCNDPRPGCIGQYDSDEHEDR